MDFQSMKRKELQSLCKKHSLPANSTNQAMAHSLSSILKVEPFAEKVKKGRSCLKRSVEIAVDEAEEISKNTKVKKVRFSPHEEFYEFEASAVGRYDLRNRNPTRRPAKVSKKAKQKEISVVQAVSSFDSLVAGDSILVRSLRSRVINSDCGKPTLKIQDEHGGNGTEEENGSENTRKSVVGDDRFLNNAIQTRSSKKGNDNLKDNGERSETGTVKMVLRRSKHRERSETGAFKMVLRRSKRREYSETGAVKMVLRRSKSREQSETGAVKMVLRRSKRRERNGTGAVKMVLRRSKRSAPSVDEMAEAENSKSKNLQEFDLGSLKCDKGTGKRTKAGESLRKYEVLSEESGLSRTRSQTQRKEGSVKLRKEITHLEEVHEKFKAENGAGSKGANCSKCTAMIVDEMAEAEKSNSKNLQGFDLRSPKCNKGNRNTRRTKASESLKKDEVLGEESGLLQTRSQMQRKEESVNIRSEIIDLEEGHKKFKAENGADSRGANRLPGSEADGDKNNYLRKTRSMTVREKLNKGGVVEVVCPTKTSRSTRSNKKKHGNSAGGDEILVEHELRGALCNKILAEHRTEDKRAQSGSKCNSWKLHKTAAEKNTVTESSQVFGVHLNKNHQRVRKNNSMAVSKSSKHDGEIVREVVLPANMRQTRSQKLKTNKVKEHDQGVVVSDEAHPVLSARNNAKTEAVDEGMWQTKCSSQEVDEMLRENTKGSKGLDANWCKYDRSLRKTRSMVAAECFKNNEVGREVDSPKDPMQAISHKQKNDNSGVCREEGFVSDEAHNVGCGEIDIERSSNNDAPAHSKMFVKRKSEFKSSQELDLCSLRCNMSPRKRKSISVSKEFKNDSKLGRGVGLSKHFRFTQTPERKDGNKTAREQEDSGKELNIDCNAEMMVVDEVNATMSNSKDPQVDGMVGRAAAPLKQSLKNEISAEVASESEDRIKSHAVAVLNEQGRTFRLKKLQRDQGTILVSGSDEITTNEDSAYVNIASDAKGESGHEIMYVDCSGRLEQGTPEHAVCVSSDGNKVTGGETVGRQMPDVVVQADSSAYDCKMGDEYEDSVNDDNKANGGLRDDYEDFVNGDNKANGALKRSKSQTGEEKCPKLTIDSFVTSCENSAEAEPKLVLQEDAALSVEQEQGSEETGSLLWSTTDNVKKGPASGKKSCGMRGFFKSNMERGERSSNELNMEFPPVTPVLTSIVISECKTVVLVGESDSADLRNGEVKHRADCMSIGKKMSDQQFGGEELSGTITSVSDYVSPVVNPDGMFHAKREYIPEKEIMESDKDVLASSSNEKVQDSFRLKSKPSGNETPTPKLMNLMCETIATPKGPHGEENVVIKQMTEEAILVSNEASLIHKAAAGPVPATTSDFTLTSSLDAKPTDAVAFGKRKTTVANSVCKHDVHVGLSPERDVHSIVQHDCGGGDELEDSQNINKMVAAHCELGVHSSPIEGHQDEELSSGSMFSAGDLKITWNASKSHDYKDPGSSNNKKVAEFIEDDEFGATADNELTVQYSMENSEKNGVFQINPQKINSENTERHALNRNEEAVSDAFEERNIESDIRFEKQNGTITKEKTQGSDWESSCQSFHSHMEGTGNESVEPNSEAPIIASDTAKARNLTSDNVILMAVSQPANHMSKLKGSFGDSTAEEMGCGCFGAVQPLEEGKSLVLNSIMVVDPDNKLGHYENGNENLSEGIECGKDGSPGREKASFGLMNVILEANEIAIFKPMEGLRQADISIKELGYQEMGSIVVKGNTEEAIVPCNNASTVQKISVRAEAASDKTESVSFDQVFVHAVQVIGSREADGNSLVCSLDMKGFSPESVVGTVIQPDYNGISEPEDTQKDNCSTSDAKHFSSIQAIKKQGGEMLSSLPIDSVDFDLMESLLVCDSNDHEGSHPVYQECFDHEIDDKEFSEQAGVTSSNSGKVDNQNIEANDSSNKKFEAVKEQLEDRYTIEIETAEAISQKLDSAASEERLDANEVSSIVSREYKDSTESIVISSAYWSLKGEELQVDSKEITKEERNIETVEETVSWEDGPEPADERRHNATLVDKCSTDFEQFVGVSLTESIEYMSETTEIECDANDTEEKLPTNQVADIVSEDFECTQMKSNIEETTEEKRNVVNSEETIHCKYVIKPINKTENSENLMVKYGSTVEQVIATAPVQLRELLELDGTVRFGETSFSPINGLDFKDTSPGGNKDSDFSYAYNISAEKQEQGPSQSAHISASALKFPTMVENLFCGCDVATDSRNPIKTASELQVEDLNTNSCMMQTQEHVRRSKTETLFKELVEGSDREKITQAPSELNCEAQGSSICTCEIYNGCDLEIIKLKEFDKSFLEEVGSISSKEVMHDKENTGKQLEGEFIYDCSTGDALVVDEENTDDSQYAKPEEEKLICEASEVVDTKAMADINAEKFNDLECAQAVYMTLDEPYAVSEVEERAFGVTHKEESTCNQLVSIAKNEEGINQVEVYDVGVEEFNLLCSQNGSMDLRSKTLETETMKKVSALETAVKMTLEVGGKEIVPLEEECGLFSKDMAACTGGGHVGEIGKEIGSYESNQEVMLNIATVEEMNEKFEQKGNSVGDWYSGTVLEVELRPQNIFHLENDDEKLAKTIKEKLSSKASKFVVRENTDTGKEKVNNERSEDSFCDDSEQLPKVLVGQEMRTAFADLEASYPTPINSTAIKVNPESPKLKDQRL